MLQLKSTRGGYLDEDNKLTVHLEWRESHLLLQSNYSKYDDITRKQSYQMRLVASLLV